MQEKLFSEKIWSFLIRQESYIPRNIRKTLLRENWNFFRVDSFYFSLFFKPGKFPSEIFNLGAKKFHFPKYKKTVCGKNISFIFLKYGKKTFLKGNTVNFFRVDIFLFFKPGLKSVPVDC